MKCEFQKIGDEPDGRQRVKCSVCGRQIRVGSAANPAKIRATCEVGRYAAGTVIRG